MVIEHLRLSAIGRDCLSGKVSHNEILWQILRDGITIGGKEYMLFTATTGQVRNVTVTLMRKDFFEKHKGFLMSRII